MTGGLLARDPLSHTRTHIHTLRLTSVPHPLPHGGSSLPAREGERSGGSPDLTGLAVGSGRRSRHSPTCSASSLCGFWTFYDSSGGGRGCDQGPSRPGRVRLGLCRGKPRPFPPLPLFVARWVLSPSRPEERSRRGIATRRWVPSRRTRRSQPALHVPPAHPAVRRPAPSQRRAAHTCGRYPSHTIRGFSLCGEYMNVRIRVFGGRGHFVPLFAFEWRWEETGRKRTSFRSVNPFFSTNRGSLVFVTVLK